MKASYIGSWGYVCFRFVRKRNLRKAMKMMYFANADDKPALLAA